MRKRTLSLLLASALSLSLALPALAAESDTSPQHYPVLTESEITYVPLRAIAAVSYTHLDVYKRQAVSCGVSTAYRASVTFQSHFTFFFCILFFFFFL